MLKTLNAIVQIGKLIRLRFEVLCIAVWNVFGRAWECIELLKLRLVSSRNWNLALRLRVGTEAGLGMELENLERVGVLACGGCYAKVIAGRKGNFLGAEADFVIDGNGQAVRVAQLQSRRPSQVAVRIVAVAESESFKAAMSAEILRAVVQKAPDLAASAAVLVDHQH